MFRRIISLLLACISLSMSIGLFAQRGTPLDTPPRTARTFTLTINTNVQGATIQINNNTVQGNRFDLPNGKYRIDIRAPGYNDFGTTIELRANQTLNATLVPSAPPKPREDNHANLFVNSNVAGAQVYINDTLVGIIGARFTIPPGRYQIRVSAPGYQDFVSNVNIRGNQTVNANLVPLMSMLTITANVPGAQVYLNNNLVGNEGSTFSLQPGTYQVRVTASGYSDYVASINLNGNQTVNAQLNPLSFSLSVNANVKNAQIYINNALVGATNQNFSLPPGTYQLRLTSPGYQDFTATIQLNGNQVINAVFQAQNGTLVVDMPRNVAMLVFIDGNLQKRPGSFPLTAGQHRVRFEMGFLAAETTVTINPGQSVTVSPAFSIQVK